MLSQALHNFAVINHFMVIHKMQNNLLYIAATASSIGCNIHKRQEIFFELKDRASFQENVLNFTMSYLFTLFSCMEK